VLGRRRSQPLTIGSVKTNIGHLEAASGMAGLLKAVVAFRAGRVAPSLHCETPNPAIPFDGLNLQLNPAGLDLAAPGRPAMIGVNSFGFGGTNSHAVLEAPPATTDTGDEPFATAPGLPQLLLSARSEGALRALAATWCGLLADGEADASLIRGAALGRDQYKLRLAATGATAADLGAALRSYLAGQATHAVGSPSCSRAMAASGLGWRRTPPSGAQPSAPPWTQRIRRCWGRSGGPWPSACRPRMRLPCAIPRLLSRCCSPSRWRW